MLMCAVPHGPHIDGRAGRSCYGDGVTHERREFGNCIGERVHLIVVQSADGSLVVGDSHHYAPTPDPFARDDVDALILDEFAQVFGQAPPPVIERWIGTYASASGHSLVETPAPGVRLAVVTGGTGASTAFGLAETVIADLLDLPQGAFA